MKDKPKYAENDAWLEDRVFGMQYLNGINPMTIQRCDKLPEGFPVTQAVVANLLDRGLTLEQELQVCVKKSKKNKSRVFIYHTGLVGRLIPRSGAYY